MSNAPQREYPAEKLLQFSVDTKQVTQSGPVTLATYLNGYTVRNSGTTWCWANGVLLNPGESIAVGGNRAEVFIGRLDLRFMQQDPAPNPAVNEATVTQKFYININA